MDRKIHEIKKYFNRNYYFYDHTYRENYYTCTCCNIDRWMTWMKIYWQKMMKRIQIVTNERVIEATKSIQKWRNGINNQHDHVYSERMKDQKNRKRNLLMGSFLSYFSSLHESVNFTICCVWIIRIPANTSNEDTHIFHWTITRSSHFSVENQFELFHYFATQFLPYSNFLSRLFHPNIGQFLIKFYALSCLLVQIFTGILKSNRLL
jgi:hypothetical protein